MRCGGLQASDAVHRENDQEHARDVRPLRFAGRPFVLVRRRHLAGVKRALRQQQKRARCQRQGGYGYGRGRGGQDGDDQRARERRHERGGNHRFDDAGLRAGEQARPQQNEHDRPYDGAYAGKRHRHGAQRAGQKGGRKREHGAYGRERGAGNVEGTEVRKFPRASRQASGKTGQRRDGGRERPCHAALQRLAVRERSRQDEVPQARAPGIDQAESQHAQRERGFQHRR